MSDMKKYGLIAAAVIAVMSIIGYFTTLRTITPGHGGVYVDNPWVFGHGGVRDEVTEPGRITTWWTTDIIEVSTAPWTVKVHVDDMMSRNKVPLDFDISMTFEMENSKAAASLIKRFNGGPVTAFNRIMMPGLDTKTMSANNPSGEFMSFLRDRVRDYHMDEFMIAQNAQGAHSDAIRDVELQAVEHMNKFFKANKVPLVVTNVALGRANPPDEVKAAMARTAEQVQLQTTEKERTRAQVERKLAEVASADADNAQQLKLGFNNAEYLRKLELETILRVCGSSAKDMKDNPGGKGNCTVIIGTAAQPVIPVTR